MSVEIKSYYTAKEIADMRLRTLPTFHRNVRTTAEKENWVSRKRSGRGGGLEYAFESLPADAQAEIKSKAYKALMPRQSPKAQRDIAVMSNRNIDTLDSEQRATADARVHMTLLVGQYEASTGSRTAAIKLVSGDEP